MRRDKGVEGMMKGVWRVYRVCVAVTPVKEKKRGPLLAKEEERQWYSMR